VAAAGFDDRPVVRAACIAAFLAASAAVLAIIPSPSYGARSAAAVSGVVISADRTQRTLYVVAGAERVYLVLAKRVFPVGARVSVSGTVQSNGWTVLAAGRSDHISRTGSATRVKVRGQLGFVDVARLRFQLGAHGQVVAEVRFPRAFGSKLVRESAFTPNRTRVFALAIVRGSLQLLSLPR
jgi:hypothetical protein